MFTFIKKAKLIAAFSAERVQDYSTLFQLEFAEFRNELIKTVVGYVVMGICALLFLVFLSAAVIVTFWDSESRVLAAWLVCFAWLLLAVGGVLIGKTALKSPSPFQELSNEVGRDIQAIKEVM